MARGQCVVAVAVSLAAAFGMVCWGLLCFRPLGLDGGADYEPCDSASESYGTFHGELVTTADHVTTVSCAAAA